MFWNVKINQEVGHKIFSLLYCLYLKSILIISETDFDTDGISVISEAECDETKYYSNENDKNWEEELQTEYLSNAFKRTSQTVIKKRRKKIKFYSDSSDDNLDYLNR